ncbi:DUF4179 domain-containing protein [Aminipila butyrica]|uniref:DUF4179 domain-containing protein n=1 Tax=Aminipila butyrica TaxID=433296 RepID=A0A858BXH3_9FIRM|nr:DUF4179 domain-containing protein [Aminipila butyrica]QIB70277.1 DUF4179 domain-containing protein [Aminipila butyrica]
MSKLEDMMKYYNLKEEDLLGSEALSEEERAQILEKTLLKAGLTPELEADTASLPTSDIPLKPKKPYRKRFALLTAACITVLALGAVSFAATSLNSTFLNFFHPQTQEETDLLNGLGTIIDQQVTNNGLTIHIKEALGDHNAVYVLFDLIAAEGTVLDQEQYTFVLQNISLEQDWSSIGPHGAGYSIQEMEDPDPTDNIKPMILSFSSSQKISGKKMTFDFKDFSTYKTGDELENRPEMTEPGTPGDENDIYNILIPGEWKIEFPLNYQDTTVAYKLNEALKYKDISFTLKEVRLSPISISMSLVTSQDISSDRLHETPLLLHLKDGTTIDTQQCSRGTSSDTFRTVIDAQFDEIINPTEIQSIEYCGTVLPIKF